MKVNDTAVDSHPMILTSCTKRGPVVIARLVSISHYEWTLLDIPTLVRNRCGRSWDLSQLPHPPSPITDVAFCTHLCEEDFTC
ncbi:unnamed protein product [Dicrocoelium dendriticum]|nr:unnamed protein product [Dicrocoelium dendriticum]